MQSSHLQQCLDDCSSCAAVCTHTAHHCLTLGGPHAAPDHQRLMHDCAALCTAAVSLMARQSDHAPDLCRLCATLCTACADDCERLGATEPAMQHCAQVCRRCAQSCHHMASATV